MSRRRNHPLSKVTILTGRRVTRRRSHGQTGIQCQLCLLHGSDAGAARWPQSAALANRPERSEGRDHRRRVLNGRVEKGMPKFNLPMQSVADIAAYVHSIKVGAGGNSIRRWFSWVMPRRARLISTARAGVLRVTR